MYEVSFFMIEIHDCGSADHCLREDNSVNIMRRATLQYTALIAVSLDIQ